MPPELDPEEAVDPEDPDSYDLDPAAWPPWTDAHRYTFTRGGGR
jgi:hypothetical protein